MTRTIETDMKASISNEASRGIVHFFKFSFSGGDVYYTTAPHNVPWNSQTWVGIGGALNFEAVVETGDLKGNGTDMTLSGVNQVLISILLSENYIGRDVEIWHGHINSSGTIVSTPIQIFLGGMNGGFTIRESFEPSAPGTVTIRGRMQDRIASLSRVRGIQANKHSHQKVFSDDEFFSHVAKTVGKKLIWGKQGGVTGGSGCFMVMLTTSLYYGSMTNEFEKLDTIRGFRDNYIETLSYGKELIDEYYDLSPKIIQEIKNNDIKSAYNNLILKSYSLIHNHQYDKAVSNYTREFSRLKSKYV